MDSDSVVTDLGSGLEFDSAGSPVSPSIIVDGAPFDRLTGARLSDAVAALRRLNQVVILIAAGEPHPDIAAAADVVFAARVAGPDAVVVADPAAAATRLANRIKTAPYASLALAWLLRATESVPVESALVSESATYSMLQTGAEFQSWLASRGPRRERDGNGRVVVSREGDLLRVTLARPQRRNAVDAAMRNALVEALSIAVADPALTVEISGDGPAFSAGGDLDEFGTAYDPAAAHVIRTTANVGRMIWQLGHRVHVRVHGACIGAGAEMPAFASRVVAAQDTWFALPEASMGLVPGAGGTVSLPRRIGRQRTAWLALSGEPISARTALSWGLVDAIE